MKIYLLRHAESTSNKRNRADSQLDVNLSSEGQNDTKRIKEELEKINPEIFFVSPLKRTRLTIEPFLKTMQSPTVIESDLLLERDLGEFAKTEMGVFQKYCEENNLDKVKTRPAKGESLEDVYNRAVQFSKEIKSKYSDKKVLVCGSKNNLMCLQIAIEGKNISDYYSFPSFKTGELRSFEL